MNLIQARRRRAGAGLIVLVVVGGAAAASAQSADREAEVQAHRARPAEEFRFREHVDRVIDLREVDPSQLDVLVEDGSSIGIIPADPPRSAGEAQAADEAANRADPPPRRQQPRPAPCAERGRPQAAATPDQQVVFLACSGIEPSVHAVTRPASADLAAAGAERAQAALAGLGAVDDSERADGYYSVLDGVENPVASTAFADRRLTIDFNATIGDIPHLSSLATGLTFLEQVLRTAFADPAVTEVVLTLDGDCVAFAVATGGELCVTHLASDPRN